MDNQPTSHSEQDPPPGDSSPSADSDSPETEPGFVPDRLATPERDLDGLAVDSPDLDPLVDEAPSRTAEAFDEAEFDLDPISPDTVEMKAAADAEAAGLQHWTAPPTGQVPAVLRDGDGGKGHVSGPSWQNDDPTWTGPDLADVFADPASAPTAAFDPDEDEDVDGYRSVSLVADDGVPEGDDGVAEGDDGVPSIDDIRFADPSEREESGVFAAADTSADRRDPERADEAPERVVASAEPTTSRRSTPSERGEKSPLAAEAETATTSDSGDISEVDFYGEESAGARELLPRVVVGLGLAALAAGTITTNPVLATLLVMAVATLAVLELYNAMRVAGLRPATLLGMVATMVCPLVAYGRGDVVFPLIMVLSVVFGCLWYLVGADTERPVLNLSLTLLGVYWIGGLSAFAGLMLAGEGGSGLLLSTILFVSISDVMAYLGGRAYGRTPFHPVSPNKTWEGTMSGFLGAVFAGFLVGVFDVVSIFDGELLPPVLLAAVVAVLGPIGDLAESLVKRDLGVKDMGTLLPGHGGVFDRIDSLLFALPGAYYCTSLLGLI